MPITILLADDSEVVRRAVRQLLEQQSDLEVVGEATSFAELDQIADDLKPEIIVTDLYMPDLQSWVLHPA
jgi:DNA-binding NarL/FixJ family response regulator